MDEITTTTSGVHKLLKDLNTHKAAGHDLIPTRVLKEVAYELAPVLGFIFNQSSCRGILPTDWLLANITGIYKKG